jgi:hypothetical protein
MPEHDKKKETTSQHSGSSRRRMKKVKEVNIQDKGRSPSSLLLQWGTFFP